MKLPVRDVLEFTGLVLVVAVVWLATGLVWATVLAGAAVLLYLSHTWDWDGDEAELERMRGDLEDWREMASRHGVPKQAVAGVQAILDGTYFREADSAPTYPVPIAWTRRTA